MFAIAVIGMTGQGKSEFVKQAAREAKAKGQRIVALDPNCEWGDIADECLRDFNHKKLVARCQVDTGDIKNSVVVFEEATGCFKGGLAMDTERMVIGKRHANNTYYFLFHSIADAPPGIIRKCNYVVLFKTLDENTTVKKRYERIYKYYVELINKPIHSKFIIKQIDQ